MPSAAFLLIDAGNTRLKWATSGMRGPLHASREDVATNKVTATWVRTFARKFPHHQVVLASVVPRLIPIFKKAFSKRLHVVTGTSPALGLRFDYPKPAELGADRLASAVAVATGSCPVIVLNCGTATAFTVLDAKGRLCGGAIAPGLQTQLSALLGATAQLPATDLKAPRRLPAKSTRDAISAGVLLNFQGGAKEILHRLSASFPKPPHVILTGGHASSLINHLGRPATLRPLLVFEGLRMIGLRAFTDVL